MMWIVLIMAFVLFVIAWMIYKLPTDPVRRPKKEKRSAAAVATQVDAKDWKEIAVRWEKKNNALLGDVEKMGHTEKKLLKEIESQKEQIRELLDKTALEKGWREKEQGNLEKAKHHEKDLKDQVIRTEKDLEREHSGRLSAERELQELKIRHEAVLDEKRQATVSAASLSTTVKHLQAQVKDLTRENEALRQKREDVQWVAKSEHDDLLRKYQQLSADYQKIKGAV